MRHYARWATFLGVAGTSFAGYLSWTRFTSGVCAFEEPCPFFLGQPACYTGFFLFAALLAVSLTALFTRTSWPITINAALSALGVLFAGRMTVLELAAPQHYRLGVPTCAWGLVFFVAFLILSLRALTARGSHRRRTGLVR